MNGLILFQLVFLLVLFAGSAFFSGAETALFSLSSTTLRKWREQGTAGQQLTARILTQPHRTLVAILLGNNLVNILAAVLVNRLAAHFFSRGAAPIAAGFLATALLLVLGEVTPKTIAYAHARSLAVRITPGIAVFSRLFAPLVNILNAFSSRILHLTAGDLRQNAVSVEEFQTYVELGRAMNEFDDTEALLLQQVFKLRKTRVSEVMTPRIDVLVAQHNWDATMLLRHAREFCHRRLPVVDGDLDHLVGILEVKRFFSAAPEQQRDWVNTCLEPPVYIPSGAALNKVLRTLRDRQRGMCIAVDEFGGVSGIVTLEDIIEEITGEMSDEFDLPSWQLLDLEPGHWRIRGSVSLHDLSEFLPLQEEDADSDTLGGLITEQLGHLPLIGERVVINGYRREVRNVERRRIVEVDIYRIESEGEESG